MVSEPYVFDTNAFDQLRSYFPRQFPTFWKHLDELVDRDGLLSTKEVRLELDGRPRPDWLEVWLKRRRAIFVTPGPAETAFVAKIFAVPHFQALVGSREILRGSPVADPFVIAVAKVRGGCVVSQEKAKPNAAKIPNVCAHFGVRCLDFEGFMGENGWTY